MAKSVNATRVAAGSDPESRAVQDRPLNVRAAAGSIAGGEVSAVLMLRCRPSKFRVSARQARRSLLDAEPPVSRRRKLTVRARKRACSAARQSAPRTAAIKIRSKRVLRHAALPWGVRRARSERANWTAQRYRDVVSSGRTGDDTVAATDTGPPATRSEGTNNKA